MNQTIVWDLRLPRIVTALTVGSALGMSGALLQGMLRNGLADPFILGISAGAGLVAVACQTLGVFQTWIPLASCFELACWEFEWTRMAGSECDWSLPGDRAADWVQSGTSHEFAATRR